MNCNRCNSENTVKNGTKYGRQQWICRDCGKQFIEPFRELSNKLPLILIFDIETAPMQAFTWSLFKPRLSHENIIKDWFVLSWAAKWLFQNGTMSNVLTPKEALNGDDGRIIKGIWTLIDDADIIIAHNGDRFDIRKLNTRFIMNDLNPPSAYQSIDTLKIIRRDKTGFSFSSNRLDYMGQLVRNKGKIETDFDLWKRCCNGEVEALSYMEKYNREDVELLEEVYMWLRPWIKGHPNIGLYMDTNEPVCTNCGSFEITWGDFYYTPAGKFSTFRCNSCGSVGRCRTTALSKGKRESLTVSTAR